MRKLFMAAVIATVVAGATACGGNGSNKGKAQEENADERTLVQIEDLDGEWIVSEIFGNAVEEGQSVRIMFENSMFSADAGCNLIHGNVAAKTKVADAISFENVISTMKLCENDALEASLKSAIGKVASFYGCGEGTVAFADGDDNVVILVKRQ